MIVQELQTWVVLAFFTNQFLQQSPMSEFLNDSLMPKLTKATETMIFVKNFDLCGGTSQHWLSEPVLPVDFF